MNLERDIIYKYKYPLIYYFVLLFIVLVSTKKDMLEPNIEIRILFTILFCIPLFKYVILTPAIIAIFSTIRLFSVSPYGYLPSQNIFYCILLLSIYLFNQYNNRKYIKVSLSIFMLLILWLFSNIINMNYDYSIIYSIIIVIILEKLIISKIQIIFIEIGFMLISFIMSIIAIVYYKEYTVKSYIEANSNRVYWVDPNYLGCVVAIGVVIAFYYSFNDTRYWTKKQLLCLFVFVFGFITILLIASRGAFLSCIICILYIYYKKCKSIKNILMFIGISSLFIYLLSYTELLNTIISRFREDTLYTGSSRTIIWSKSFPQFINMDIITLLFGGGTNYSYILCGKSINIQLASPHNNYLQILYDYGIVGIITFLYIIYKTYKKRNNDVLIISLNILILVVCLSLSPFMYLPFWYLIVLIDKK